MNYSEKCLHDWIDTAMTWSLTVEGESFWYGLRRSIRENIPPPAIPEFDAAKDHTRGVKNVEHLVHMATQKVTANTLPADYLSKLQRYLHSKVEAYRTRRPLVRSDGTKIEVPTSLSKRRLLIA